LSTQCKSPLQQVIITWQSLLIGLAGDFGVHILRCSSRCF